MQTGKLAAVALFATLAWAGPASAEVTRIQSNPQALILDAAEVSAGTDMLYLSGQLPSPLDPAKPMSAVTSLEEMGDTRAQTISTLTKIKGILESRGYEMSDLIKLTLFVAADPRLGRMDFAGVNEGFSAFFKTGDNPHTVARSTFQVAGLVGPHYLIEIEAVAAKKPDE